MDYGDEGVYHGHDGQMYVDGDMMGSDEDGMDHDMMGDSYGNEGSPGYHDVSFLPMSKYHIRDNKRK